MTARFIAFLLVLAPTSAFGGDLVKVTHLRDGTRRFTYQRPVVIVGQRHEPMATYVLSRTRSTYERKELVRPEKTSLNQIVEAVRRKPF